MGCGLSYPFRGNRARVSDTLAAAPALSGSRPSAEMGQRRRDVHVVHRRRSAKTRSVNPRKLLQSTDKTAVSALQQPLPLKAGTKVMGVQEGMNTNDIPAEVLVAMDNIAGSVRACKTPLQSAYVSMTSLSDRDSGYKEETFSARRLLTGEFTHSGIQHNVSLFAKGVLTEPATRCRAFSVCSIIHCKHFAVRNPSQ